MIEHKETRYEFDGFVVELTDKKNVRVKPKKEKKYGGDDDGEDEAE